jgi:hypothetical protein
MAHIATAKFWIAYDRLPEAVRDLAEKNYELLKTNPQHPSLHFKKVGDFWSVRIGRNYRALAVDSSEGMAWFWIGPHSEYEKLIRS